MTDTSQAKQWSSRFGDDYVDRNAFCPDDLDALYKRNYGVSRSELNEAFIGGFERSIKILEVGCNTCNQLLSLQKMNFEQLFGIEINSYAIQKAKTNTQNIKIIRGSAFDIPFKDNYFDMVFTSGVLIHIAPVDISKAIMEIYRCSKEYIWGFEYYADEYTEVTYRGNKDLLWKTDFAKLYLDTFDDLELVKEEKIKYSENDSIDTMFLIKKTSGKQV